MASSIQQGARHPQPRARSGPRALHLFARRTPVRIQNACSRRCPRRAWMRSGPGLATLDARAEDACHPPAALVHRAARRGHLRAIAGGAGARAHLHRRAAGRARARCAHRRARSVGAPAAVGRSARGTARHHLYRPARRLGGQLGPARLAPGAARLLARPARAYINGGGAEAGSRGERDRAGVLAPAAGRRSGGERLRVDRLPRAAVGLPEAVALDRLRPGRRHRAPGGDRAVGLVLVPPQRQRAARDPGRAGKRSDGRGRAARRRRADRHRRRHPPHGGRSARLARRDRAVAARAGAEGSLGRARPGRRRRGPRGAQPARLDQATPRSGRRQQHAAGRRDGGGGGRLAGDRAAGSAGRRPAAGRRPKNGTAPRGRARRVVASARGGARAVGRGARDRGAHRRRRDRRRRRRVGGARVRQRAAQRGRGLTARRVEDRGRGVEPARESELFEPFFTTKPEGTGLGLAISRAIARAHGGELTYARAGAVTRFSLSLPSRGAAA